METPRDSQRPLVSLRRQRWLPAVAILVAAGTGAAEVSRFSLEPDSDGHRLLAQARIDAPKDAVWRVLTDYADLDQVSPRILESELVARSPDGVARIRTLNRLCFLVFCQDLRHVQLVREVGPGEFESTSVPGESDLDRGHARWRLRAEDGGTRLDIDFRFRIAPSYSGWLPAWVTRFVARRALEGDAVELIEGIERTVRAAGDATNGD